MINTAIEATLDLSTPSFDPLAKIAKDIGRRGRAHRLGQGRRGRLPGPRGQARRPDSTGSSDHPRRRRSVLTVIATVLTILIVIAVKALTRSGTPLRGGLPSGHAALAFGTWMSITFITQDFEYRVARLVVDVRMALLVAQTRVESGVHSSVEVAAGAVLGTLVSMILFQVLG